MLLSPLAAVGAAPAAAGAAPERIGLDAHAVAEPFALASSPKRKRWLRGDGDRDGLSNRVETRRTLTDPLRADSDGDGLTDGVEARLTHTNPRRADSDGDGFDDGAELLAGSDPWNPASVPAPLAPIQPPNPLPAPTAGVSPPGSPSELPPPPPPPGDYPDACDEPGATEATSASAVRDAVDDGEDVCVTDHLGDVDLDDLGSTPSTVSTEGDTTMGDIDLDSTTDLTISRARFESIELRGSHHAKLLGNNIGGTASNRVDDQLIFMPSRSDDVRIEGNDIGWTITDDSDPGNTGYGCRCYGELNGLRFVGNRVHDIAADGFQGVGGENVLIDRNEIGPVGRDPGSEEHSDNIQITGNGSNLRITNNWIHHQGYYGGEVTANAGSTYIHGGSTGDLLYANNLIEIARGRTEICGLGTGGTSRSNITIRRNTWVDGGQTFANFPSFKWACTSGSDNLIERNVSVDPDGGFSGSGAATFSDNIWGEEGDVTLDADGNCVSAECNPPDEEPIGYRKPSDVNW